MKIENLLLLGGLAFIGYWVWKKNPKIIDVSDNPVNTNQPKTIILNLNDVQGRVPVLDSVVNQAYNTKKSATVSPAKVEIGGGSNFYDL